MDPGDSLRHWVVTKLLGHRAGGDLVEAADRRTGELALIKLPQSPRGLAKLRTSGVFVKRLLGVGHPALHRLCGVYLREAVPFAVFEPLAGTPLDELVAKRGPLSPARAIDLAQQLIGALEALAQARLVHGALRPEVVRLDDDNRLQLLDAARDPHRAGLADAELRAAQALAVSAPADTVDAAATLEAHAWRAPELTRATPTPQSDLYGAALVVLFALAGRPPGRHIGRTLDGLADVPKPLRFLLDACLSAEPGRRPDTPAKLAAALAKLSPPISRAPRAPRKAQEGTAGVTRTAGVTPGTEALFRAAEQIRVQSVAAEHAPEAKNRPLVDRATNVAVPGVFPPVSSQQTRAAAPAGPTPASHQPTTGSHAPHRAGGRARSMPGDITDLLRQAPARGGPKQARLISPPSEAPMVVPGATPKDERVPFWAHQAPVHACVATPDGLVVSGDLDGVVFAWSARDGRRRWRAKVPAGVRTIAIGPNAVLIGTEDGEVRSLDKQLGTTGPQFAIDWPVTALTYDAYHDRVICGQPDGTLSTFSHKAGRALAATEGDGLPILRLAVLHDFCYAADAAGRLRVWRVVPVPTLVATAKTAALGGERLTGMCVNDAVGSGGRVVVGGKSGKLHVAPSYLDGVADYAVTTGGKLPFRGLSALAGIAGEGRVAAGGDADFVAVVDPETGVEKQRFGPLEPPCLVVTTPAGQPCVIAGGSGGKLMAHWWPM